MTGLTRITCRLAAVCLLAILSGCGLFGTRPPSNDSGSMPSTLPGSNPGNVPSTSPTNTPPATTKPPATLPSHPRYAPPPGAKSYWDVSLGVYVLPGEIYYRERSYYRWNDGWSWASHANGPWEATESSEVPPGLVRKYGQ